MFQFLAALLLVWCSTGLAAAALTPRSGDAKAIEIPQGEIVEVKIPAPGMTAIEVRMGDQPIHFFTTENGERRGLIGADVEAKPGWVKMVVRGIMGSGAVSERRLDVRIKAKAFKQESFKVAAEYDQFTPELLRRIRDEQKQFARAFEASAPKRLWEPPFISPLPVEITSPFGYRRVINGTPRAPHTGVDLKAAAGTAIAAANHGRIVLTGEFYFAGRAIVLDHGGGLLTMYFHLSDVKVEKGAEVRRGDVIALSGMSGRVTGPHLHWAARLDGARVDPLQLIEKFGEAGMQILPPGLESAEK